MTYALATAVALGVMLPHWLDLRRAAPATAMACWGAALGLRAITGVFVGLYLLLFLRRTELFDAVTHWCWHTVLPLLATNFGLDGHRVGDAAVILPAFLLAASTLSVAFGIARAARSIRRLLDRGAIGTGPHDSVIIGGADILVAAAGIVRPRIVVSAGALTMLEDDELAAGLDHEKGHIARRHRFILVLGTVCHSVGRFVPGGRHALTQLRFHLERDADRYALRNNEPLALASAICKAATSAKSHPGLVTLAGSGTTERLQQLLDGEPEAGSGRGTPVLTGLAVALVGLALGLAALVPPTVAAGSQVPAGSEQLRHCAS
jgi:Zn-dependent protease with chaperone function